MVLNELWGSYITLCVLLLPHYLLFSVQLAIFCVPVIDHIPIVAIFL